MNEAIRVSLISLGCARNLVDSEVLLGHAAENGLLLAQEPEDADVVIVNTCGFVEDAKQESIDTILQACELKKAGQIKAVLAVGCLTQRYAQELAHELGDVDAFLPISDYSAVPELVRRIVEGSPQGSPGQAATPSGTTRGGRPKSVSSDQNRLLLTPKSYSYLRISEGCNHSCSFCAIPAIRGRNRSKPVDLLVDEARGLARSGVRELVLIAEDSTAYGLDLEGKRQIHEVLWRLNEVEGIEWIRLLYAYPHTVGPELILALRDCAKVLPYLDIPIQHISGPMLKAMRRGVSSARVRDILWRLRQEVPGIVVRSTLILGFPGETDADFRELCDFVQEYRFERLGSFAYSREEGTPAFELENQVDPELATARQAELMALQKGILDEHNQSLVGKSVAVLVDGRSPDGNGFVGRTRADAPEIDCVVKLPDGDLHSGDLVTVRVTGVEDYDLLGVVAEAE